MGMMRLARVAGTCCTGLVRLGRRAWQALVHPQRARGSSVRFIRDESRICPGSESMLCSYRRGTSMLEPSEEMELHLGLERGDEKALAQALERHRDRLVRVVRIYSDPRLAKRVSSDDILQELYLSAAARLAHYAGDGFNSTYTWLRVVLRQTLIDLHRRHLGTLARDARREVAHAGTLGASTRSMARELSGSITSPSGVAMRVETHAALIAALEGVPPGDREIIALRHFEDLANEEVAETLGITAKAASIRYVRALRRLGALLTQAGLSFGDLHVRR